MNCHILIFVTLSFNFTDDWYPTVTKSVSIWASVMVLRQLVFNIFCEELKDHILSVNDHSLELSFSGCCSQVPLQCI